MGGRITSLAKQGAAYGLGTAMRRAIDFFLIPLYTRLLSPADYGMLDILNTTSAILLAFAQFGMTQALLRSYFIDCEDENDRKDLFGTALFAVLAVAGVILIPLLAASHWLAAILLGARDKHVWVILIGCTMALNAVSAIPMAVFRLREQPGRYVALSGLQTLITCGSAVVFVAVLRLGPLGVLLGLFLGSLAAFPGFVLVRRSLRLRFSGRLLRGLVGFGLPSVPNRLIGLVMKTADRYFLRAFRGFAEIGLYGLAHRLSMGINILFEMPISIAYPVFVLKTFKEPDAEKVFGRIFAAAVFAGCGLWLAASLLARDVLRLIAVPEYWPASRLVPIVAVGYVIRGLHYAIVPAIYITGRRQYTPLLLAAAAAINIVLNIVLVPRYGVFGAAVANMVASLADTAMFYCLCQHLLRLEYPVSRAARTVVLAFACFLGGFWLPSSSVIASISSRSGLLAAFFVVGVLIGALPREDVWMGLSFIRSKFSGIARCRAEKGQGGNENHV